MAWKKYLLSGDTIGSLTATAYRTFYSEDDGDIRELTHGAKDKLLTSNGVAADPSWAHARDYGDIRPSSPLSEDDEFDGSSLDPKWSTLNSANRTAYDVNSTIPSHYYAIHRDESGYGDYFSGIYQTLTATGFDIRAKLSFGGKHADYIAHALAVAENNESTVGKMACIQLQRTTSNGIQIAYYNSPTSWNSTKYSFAYSPNFAYFRIKKVLSNLYFFYSTDGLTWIQLYNEAFSFFTIGYCGIFANNNNTGLDLYAACDWFRRIS